MKTILGLLSEIFTGDSSWSYRKYRLGELLGYFFTWVGLGTTLYWLGKGGWLLFTHFFVVTVR